MMSQLGSLARAARSPPADGRFGATGTVRSAILTYFDQIVIQYSTGTKGSCRRPLPQSKRCAGGAGTLSWGLAKTYRDLARDAKAEATPGRRAQRRRPKTRPEVRGGSDG